MMSKSKRDTFLTMANLPPASSQSRAALNSFYNEASHDQVLKTMPFETSQSNESAYNDTFMPR